MVQEWTFYYSWLCFVLLTEILPLIIRACSILMAKSTLHFSVVHLHEDQVMHWIPELPHVFRSHERAGSFVTSSFYRFRNEVLWREDSSCPA